MVAAEWSELQVDAALEWIRRDYHHPSRTDYYLMALRAEVRFLLSKPPTDFSLEQLRVRFGVEKEQSEDVRGPTLPAPVPEEEQQARDKALMKAVKAEAIARVGGKVRVIQPTVPSNG